MMVCPTFSGEASRRFGHVMQSFGLLFGLSAEHDQLIGLASLLLPQISFL